MLYVFVGSSGSGKNTIAEKYFGKEKEVVSFTTRKKRPKEINGIDYYFISEDEVSELENKHQLVEHSIYDGNHYGLSKYSLYNKLNSGDCYAILDFNGYKSVKEILGDSVIGIYIDLDIDTLMSRLKNRNESDEFISKRLELFKKEQLEKNNFKYIIKNNISLENSILQLEKIIEELME